MTSLKIKILNIYYTAQVGYSAIGWLLSLVAYTSIFVVAVHLLLPSIAPISITFATPVVAFLGFLGVGYFFLYKDGYRQQAAFGGKKNPARLGWELSLAGLKLNIASTNVLIQLAEKNNIDCTELRQRINEFAAFKQHIEELLGE